jgi:hypothetical protein
MTYLCFFLILLLFPWQPSLVSQVPATTPASGQLSILVTKVQYSDKRIRIAARFENRSSQPTTPLVVIYKLNNKDIGRKPLGSLAAGQSQDLVSDIMSYTGITVTGAPQIGFEVQPASTPGTPSTRWIGVVITGIVFAANYLVVEYHDYSRVPFVSNLRIDEQFWTRKEVRSDYTLYFLKPGTTWFNVLWDHCGSGICDGWSTKVDKTIGDVPLPGISAWGFNMSKRNEQRIDQQQYFSPGSQWFFNIRAINTDDIGDWTSSPLYHLSWQVSGTTPAPPPRTPLEIFRYNGPDHSPEGLILMSFRISAPGIPLHVGDEIEVQFSLSHVAGLPVQLGPFGVLTGCRDPNDQNRDFGYMNQGMNMTGRSTVSFSGKIKLDKVGTWSFWPAYSLPAGGWGPFRWHEAKINVLPR